MSKNPFIKVFLGGPKSFPKFFKCFSFDFIQLSMTKLFDIQITLEILVYTLSKHLICYTPSHQKISNSTKNVRGRGGEVGTMIWAIST